MRRQICALALLFTLPCAGIEASWDAKSEEEALFLRRIADFWQEGEYQVVKGQIEDFLKEYPESSFSQTLNATLGDLYIREKNFKGALMRYARIDDPDLGERIFLNRMQCLLELQWFATLSDECEAYLQQELIHPEQKFRATYLLAISLYQQCLNAPKDSEALVNHAKRAQPHFQVLLNSEISQDLAQAFAHLCCILKDFDSASKIYLRMAKESDSDEMLFQAALLQAEYDKDLAMQTFESIALQGRGRSRDALYNRMVLAYDSGQYETLIAQKDNWLLQLAEERHTPAHLFFGRSFLHLKKYPEALQELLLYASNTEPSEILRTAFLDILESSYRLGDEPTLSSALHRFSELFPNDPQLSVGFLGRAMLLKKTLHLQEARQELKAFCTRFPDAPEIETALFERLHLEFQEGSWEPCRALCREFLQRFNDRDLAPFAWRFLAASSAKLAETNQELKVQLASDLKLMLLQNTLLSNQEKNDWTLLLSRTSYELKRYEEAIVLLEPLVNLDFPERANATLLLALCYRDGFEDLEKFCKLAEIALSLHANLLDVGNLHIALFNGYLPQKRHDALDLAADHLYIALQMIPIESENLLWLADFYYEKSPERSVVALEKFLSGTGIDIQSLDETTLPFETALIRLAELQGILGQIDKQTALLENLKRQHEARPSLGWKEESKVDLLLAECYAKSGKEDTAIELFDGVVAKNPTIRTFAAASASLQGARLRLAKWISGQFAPSHPDFVKALSQLKDLILQRTLANEPVHLEAAIEYIDLQTPKRDQRRLSLLTKTKADFESAGDLLSRDYQNGRKALIEKDRILSAYLRFFDAEIFYCKADLASDDAEKAHLIERAKKLYLEIMTDPATTFLHARAVKQLERLHQ